ncbi:uncharacterized protein LOC118446003 [Vespa mandarinia]|uniref:uncharacterized protein LOC118446003 n=1 Tax=Vespa mandarinia TaxID=7446 RepID=UPI00162135E7|nr:uncharacterized protein LOC118446003 [Vespa mandarinia]
MYDEAHKWLIIGHNLKESLKIIDDSNFNIATDVIIAEPSTNGYVLYDIYNLSKDHGGSLKTILFGTWHKETGLYVTLIKQKFNRRANLQGMKLNVGVLFDHKLSNISIDKYLLDYNNKSKDSHSKFMYAILINIAELYNFTMNITKIDPWEKRGGKRGPMFTAFKEDIIDIYINPTMMITEKLNYGDIIAPVWPVRTCFLFRTISSTNLRFTQFIRPLSIHVWYAMLIIIALTAFILLTVLRKEGFHDFIGLCGISILSSIGAISQQASAVVPYGIGGRIAFLHIMFFSLLIFNYYSASMVSNRLRNIENKMNDSLISLADSNFKIAIEPTEYINSLLQEPYIDVKYFYENRWLKLPQSMRYLPMEKGLNHVAKGGFAYHTLTESAYPYIERTFETRIICELMEVHLFRTTLGLWTRKNGPFTEMLRIGFTKMNNVGLRDRELKRWSARKPRCPASMLIAEAISIHEAAPILLFLVVGMVLSLSVCAIENIIFWFWSKRPCFMLLSTPTNRIKLDLFLKPFTIGIWDTYAVFMVISMIIVGLILKREKVKSEEGFGAIVLTIGIMSQQGAYFFPKNLAGRIAVVQILLFSWMMYNYYSCSIVSARLSEPFDKIEDSVAVLADTHMRIAAEAVPYLNYLLKKWNWESDYFRKKRWDPLPLSKRYLPIEEGIRQVGQGVLAYHTDPNTAYPYIEKMFDSNQICQLTEIHLFKESVMGMYSSHNAQFLEIARVGLIKMQSTGLRNRQIKYWSSKKPQCQQDALSTRSITIYETAPAFILITLGILMSSVICLTENIYFHRFTQHVPKEKVIIMFMKGFLHFQLVFLVFAQSNEIIRDYFIHKRIPTVVGFSCGDIINDFQMTKMLNEVGISISIKGPSAKFNFLRFLNVNYWKLGVFVDLRCQDQNATTIFDQSTGYRMYDYAYNWFVLAPNISYCLYKLNDTAFSVTTDFVVSVPNYDYYELYDIYNPNKERGGILNITRYATWNKDNGLMVFLLETKILRRWNFHKLKIIVSSAIEHKPKNVPLLDYLEDHDNITLEDWPKIGFTLVQLIANIFNFSMHVKGFTSWTDYTNGPMMDSLIEGTVDIGYQPSLVIHKRLDIAKILMEIMPARTCFMFLTLPSTTIQFNNIFRPLTWTSWYMIFFFFIISFLIYSFIIKSDSIKNKDYGSSLLTTLGAICQQGAQNMPIKFASRIALFQIGVYGLLIYNYYSAAIVSARLNIPNNKLNDSLYKLVASKMKLASENTVITNIILQDHNPEMIYFKNHWSKIPQKKKIMSVETGIIKIMQGGFAYHGVPEHAYYYINNYFDQKMICQLTEIHWLRPTRAALYTNRKGHYHEVGKIGLMKIFSAGLLKRELKRTFTQKPYCQNDVTSVESVTIYEAAPIIILLICGITLSIIICLIENIIFRITKIKQFNIIRKC